MHFLPLPRNLILSTLPANLNEYSIRGLEPVTKSDWSLAHTEWPTIMAFICMKIDSLALVAKNYCALEQLWAEKKISHLQI